MRNLLSGLVGIVAIFVIYSCQKEVSTEYGASAKGSLQGNGGDCLPKLVGGSYVANKALNDSNFLEVTVNVTASGPYSITTDTINGYSYKATGTFTNTGSNTVRLKGTGSPTNPGVNDFSVVFDSSICQVSVTVLPAGTTGGPAVFTLVGSPSGCSAFNLTGTYYKDTTLDVRHTVKVNVNVTSVGTYTVSTTTVNGYTFSGTGTFGATGPTQITLQGSGKPVAVGTNNFTVTAGTSSCTFPVTVVAGTAPPTGPCGATPQGTYTAGTALAAANTIQVSHTYATAGSYTASTTTVNGYSFSSGSITATAGSPTNITLNGTGTPTAAGTNTFTINFGDGQSCTFTVTVGGTTPPVNNDYFPIALNNWWSYNYTGGNADTLIMKVTGSTQLGGNTYQRFEWSSPAAGGPFAEYFYRKDAATGFYYEGIDTTGFGPEVTFTQRALDIKFLQNTLTTGQTWNNDFPVTLNVPGIPAGPSTLRFKYTCDNNNVTLTTATGRTLTNVYQVSFVIQVLVGGQFVDASDPIKTYFAKGIGQVKYRDDSDPQNIYEENIRYWLVN